MRSTLETILIIFIFVLLTIWLFQGPKRCDKSAPVAQSTMESSMESTMEVPQFNEREEYYDNAANKYTIEPSNNRDSYGVRFMPMVADSNESLGDDYTSFQILDHLKMQEAGPAFRRSYESHPRAGKVTYKDQGQNLSNVVPESSLMGTVSYGDRVFDSDGINRECTTTTVLKNDAYRYDDEVSSNAQPVLEMTKDEYNSMVLMRPHMKTYIELDQTAGKYDNPPRAQDIRFEELTDTIDRYRNDTLGTIRNEESGDNSAQSQLYDRLR